MKKDHIALELNRILENAKPRRKNLDPYLYLYLKLAALLLVVLVIMLK